MAAGHRRRLVDQGPVGPSGRGVSGPSTAWRASGPAPSGRRRAGRTRSTGSGAPRTPPGPGTDSTRAHAAIRASCSSGPSRAKLWPRTDSTAVAVRARASTTTPSWRPDDPGPSGSRRPGSARRRPTASGPGAAGGAVSDLRRRRVRDGPAGADTRWPAPGPGRELPAAAEPVARPSGRPTGATARRSGRGWARRPGPCRATAPASQDHRPPTAEGGDRRDSTATTRLTPPRRSARPSSRRSTPRLFERGEAVADPFVGVPSRTTAAPFAAGTACEPVPLADRNRGPGRRGRAVAGGSCPTRGGSAERGRAPACPGSARPSTRHGADPAWPDPACPSTPNSSDGPAATPARVSSWTLSLRGIRAGHVSVGRHARPRRPTLARPPGRPTARPPPGLGGSTGRATDRPHLPPQLRPCSPRCLAADPTDAGGLSAKRSQRTGRPSRRSQGVSGQPPGRTGTDWRSARLTPSRWPSAPASRKGRRRKRAHGAKAARNRSAAPPEHRRESPAGRPLSVDPSLRPGRRRPGSARRRSRTSPGPGRPACRPGGGTSGTMAGHARLARAKGRNSTAT